MTATTREEDPIIQVRNISKKYNIGMDKTYKTFSESFTNAIRNPLKSLQRVGYQHDPFWALKDINFDVNRGEVVGIIGRNGAGKSTLLKILSRITAPTEGEIRLKGRVGSLLEVGTGFHPELTGRENIYFNGAILGMKKKEIDDKFDEIVKFSGVEKFLDTPVKRYSSGMQVRLAFSVAAHLDPEILIIDEVLAVGDVQFQEKCLGKMEKISNEGRTILFVSHNMSAIKKFCNRTILLDSGKVVFDGDTFKTIEKYSIRNHIHNSKIKWDYSNAPSISSGKLLEVELLNDGKSVGNIISTELPIQVSMKFIVTKNDSIVGSSVNLYIEDGSLLFSSISNHEANWHMKKRPKGIFYNICEIPPNLLAEGSYSISVVLWEGFYENGLVEDNIIKFSAHEKGYVRGDYPFEKKAHIIRPLLKWSSFMEEDTST